MLVVRIILIAIMFPIFRKTGLSGWLASFCIIPTIGPFICMILLASLKWPVRKELCCLKLEKGLGEEDDAKELLALAMKHEAKGEIDSARELYEKIVEGHSGSSAASDAEISLRQINKTTSEPPVNPLG